MGKLNVTGKPKIITYDLLRLVCACKEDARKFRKLWPRGARVDRTNILKALTHGLNVNWFFGEVYYRLCGRRLSDAWVGDSLYDLDQERDAKMDKLGAATRESKAERVVRWHQEKEAKILLRAWSWMWKDAKQAREAFRKGGR